MIYILENEQLRVKVSSLGAEMQSIRRVEDGTEYLWQGDAQYWARRASNLFPICGRLWDNQYIYRGKTYEMGSHGFARGKEWEVIHQKATALTLQLVPDEDTLARYPFRFCLEMTYSLNEDRLSVTTIVHNEDDKEMPFSVGGHPGFNVPLTEDTVFEDYKLVFDTPCQPLKFICDENCFFLDKMTLIPIEDNQILPLHHGLFDDDAIFLQNTCGGVTLCSEKSERSVHIAYPDSPYLGIWHTPKSDAPFVCLEPWVQSPSRAGEVSNIEDKADMICLNPGETYRNTYTITCK